MAYLERKKNIKHQVVEKLFREIAPKYKKRAEEKGQGCLLYTSPD